VQSSRRVLIDHAWRKSTMRVCNAHTQFPQSGRRVDQHGLGVRRERARHQTGARIAADFGGLLPVLADGRRYHDALGAFAKWHATCDPNFGSGELETRAKILVGLELPIAIAGSLALIAVALLLGCMKGSRPTGGPVSALAEVRAISLPGAPASGVAMDYLAYDRSHHRVWVPAGNTGSVDVVDTDHGHVTRIDGFPTSEIERNGKRRIVGPKLCDGR
jgi:hypothetical protein